MLEITHKDITHQLASITGGLVQRGGNTEPFATLESDTRAMTIHVAGKDYRVLLLDHDPDTRTLRLQVNGKQVSLQLKDRAQLYAERIGVNMAASRKLSELRAPMPGLVRAIHVQPGDTVAKGDPLVTLEAMKMENVLKAAAEGVVGMVAVEKDAAVEKGALLIGFE